MMMQPIGNDLNQAWHDYSAIVTREGPGSLNAQQAFARCQQLSQHAQYSPYNVNAAYGANSSNMFQQGYDHFRQQPSSIAGSTEKFSDGKYSHVGGSNSFKVETNKEPIRAFSPMNQPEPQQPVADTAKPVLGHEHIFTTYGDITCKKEVSGIDNTYKYEIYGDLSTVQDCKMKDLLIISEPLKSLNDVELEMLGNNVDYLACKIEDTNYRKLVTSIDNINARLKQGSFTSGELSNLFTNEYEALSNVNQHYAGIVNLVLRGALRLSFAIENIGEDIMATVNRFKDLSIDKKSYFSSIQSFIEQDIKKSIRVDKTKFDSVKSVTHVIDAVVINNDDIVGNLLELLPEHKSVSLREASNPYLYNILDQYTKITQKDQLPIVIYILNEVQGFSKLAAIRDTYNNFVISDLNV